MEERIEMKTIILKKLGDLSQVDLSNVDKKTKDNERLISLCNFVDVYKNWAITKELEPSLMNASATNKQIEKFAINKGQVAITKDSEKRDDIGISTYMADDMPNTILGYHCALIKPNKDTLSGKFLNLVLHSPYALKYWEMNASGSGQRYALSKAVIEAFLVPIRDITTQKNIGNLFSFIDRKIELNKTINKRLEKMAKDLYDYWFVQFDFPDENKRPLLFRISKFFKLLLKCEVRYA